MATDIYMPLLGLTMSEGTVNRWLKAEGQQINKGEIVLEIETDKATVDIEAPDNGVLGPILVAEGVVVPIGTVLSFVLAPGEQAPATTSHPVEALQEQPSASHVEVAARPDGNTTSRRGRLFASPLARRIAANAGVDLNHIEASGPNGRIVAADVRWYLDHQKPAAPESHPAGKPTPMSNVRRLTAERMAASKQTAAHVTLMLEADATNLAAWRSSLKADGHVVSYNDLLLLLLANVLGEHPGMMAQIIDGGQVRIPAQIDIGLAVDTPRGLLVPVVRDVANKGLLQIAGETQSLVERARSGKIHPDDLQGGVFTISNLGAYEIEAFTPIINIPETAILGVGSIAQRAVVRDDQVIACLTVIFSLAFDHRAVDGAPAARFLQRLKHLVERPLDILN